MKQHASSITTIILGFLRFLLGIVAVIVLPIVFIVLVVWTLVIVFGGGAGIGWSLMGG